MVSYVSPVKCQANTIINIRHTQSIGNERGRSNESLREIANHKFPLTEKGIRQANMTADYLKENSILQPDCEIYVSSFLRAQQTLEVVLDNLGLDQEVSIDPRLDEWWKGIFYSMSAEEISEYYPMEAEILSREGWYHYRPPQGQAGKDVETNLLSFLEGVDVENILIVGHGKSSAFLKRLLTNEPLDINCGYPHPKNGEIWKFQKNERFYDFESLYVPWLPSHR